MNGQTIRALVLLATVALPAATAAQTITFAPKVDFATAERPYYVSIADLNGDGTPDAVTSNGDATLSVLRGTRTGSFDSRTDIGVAAVQIGKPVVGDVNRDGRLDIVVAGGNRIFVLPGTASGFGQAIESPTTAAPAVLALADFNRDGRLDVATGRAVLIGAGNGTFGSEVSLGAASFPSDVAIADLNRDGRLDVLTASSLANLISVHIGSGTGTFAARVDYGAAMTPGSIMVGDVDGDGKSDVVVGNLINFSIFIGTGSGTLSAPTTLNAVPLGVGALRHSLLADLNVDGKLDIVTESAGSAVSMFPGTGTGSFGAEVRLINTPLSQFALADINGDTRDDLISANGGWGESDVSVMLNTTAQSSAGFFATRLDVPVLADAGSVILEDWNRDGKLDFAVNLTGGYTAVHAGTGLGTFSSAVQPIVNWPTFAIADVNLDGRTDLLSSASSSVMPHAGLGDGTFGGAPLSALGFTPDAMAVGDLNRDGKPDVLAIARDRSSVSLLLGTGTGAFGARVDFPVGVHPSGVEVADFNRDGNLDVIVFNSESSTITTLLGDGNGILGSRQDMYAGQQGNGMALGDLNRDGVTDLVVADAFTFGDGPRLRVFLGTGTGTFTEVAGGPRAGYPGSPAIADLNRDGKPDVVVTTGENTIAVLFGAGDGTLHQRTEYVTGLYPTSIAIGDVNRDGLLDIVAANNGGSSVTVLLNGSAPAADLSVTMSGAPAQVLPGGRVTYTVTVTNNGPNPAAGASVSIAMPASFFQWSSDPRCSYSSVLICELGTILSGGRVTLSNVLTATTSGAFTLTARASANVIDANLANNTASVSTAIGRASFALDRTSLQFGASSNGASFTSQTAPQVVRLTQSGAGAVTWTASASDPWLIVTPASGTGSGALNVTVAFVPGLPIGASLSGSITLSFPGASPASATIAVTLQILQAGGSVAPFGVVDTPLDNTTGVTGSMPMTGWALDDVDVAAVAICRALAAGEAVAPDGRCGNTPQIYLGNATFVDGARPDVRAAYPGYPRSSAAGWGFMILTNMLPNQGNGSYAFTAYASDRDGHTVSLGTRRITAANSSAFLPFGTIDTPDQGETVSGASFVNFGWALTQASKMIPLDGSTITVYVDGVAVGSPSYNHYRADIASLFRGLANSDGAVGYKILDTTTLSNGMHTIVWTATDSAGQTAGLGSRYFRVSNGVQAAAVASAALNSIAVPDLASVPVDDSHVVARRGWDDAAPFQNYGVGRSGRTVIRGEEIDRFVVELGDYPNETVAGYLRVGDELMPLPAGSRFDADSNTFTWSPGAGFVGTYDLVFVRSSGADMIARRELRIIIGPKGTGHVGR